MVELTAEREAHIRARHPDLLPKWITELEETIHNPDKIVPDPYHRDKQAFAKWFASIGAGKFVIAQVVTDPGTPDRHWIVTAYLDSDLPS
jgi:hypothetical protein